MIVDDNRSFRQLIRSILQCKDRVFIECEDGASAQACYGEARPDWVLMDLEMKSMDGLEATRRITSQFPGARVLVVSQHDELDWQAAALKAGATRLLSKENLVELPGILDPLTPPNPSST